MKNNIKVSIVMPVYNSSRFVKQSIESVMRQNYEDWELVIIDDGSTDKTVEIVKKFAVNCSRIRVILNKKNQGLVFTLNKGIRLTKGEYIARIDGDDIWTDREKIKKQVNFLDKNPEYGMVGTWGVKIDENGREVGHIHFPSNDQKIREYMLIENCFIHSSVMMRIDLVKRLGLYSKKYEYAEDYALWLKMGTQSKFFNIQSEMVAYRITSTGITKRRYDKQVECTLELVGKYRLFYKNFYPGLFFWHLRRVTPISIKDFASGFLRRI